MASCTEIAPIMLATMLFVSNYFTISVILIYVAKYHSMYVCP